MEPFHQPAPMSLAQRMRSACSTQEPYALVIDAEIGLMLRK